LALAFFLAGAFLAAFLAAFFFAMLIPSLLSFIGFRFYTWFSLGSSLINDSR
jgi:hypothetical protein